MSRRPRALRSDHQLRLGWDEAPKRLPDESTVRGIGEGIGVGSRVVVPVDDGSRVAKGLVLEVRDSDRDGASAGFDTRFNVELEDGRRIWVPRSKIASE